MGKYKPYPEYKDSGVEWLGDVPRNWSTAKLSWTFQAEKGRNAQALTKEYCASKESLYPVYSGQTNASGIMGYIESYEFDVGEDGVLFSTTVGAKAMTLSHLRGCFSLSQNCMIIRSTAQNILINFYFYHLQPLFAYERGLIPDHMQASFRMEDLYQYRFMVPPVDEQTQIAAFLDHETAKIDRLIEKQEKLIELLKEKRQAVISHAVTKGLNPDAPMKDSGVEWLGEVPEHWKIISSKFLYKEQSRPVRTEDQIITAYRDGEVTLRLNRRATGYTLADKEVGYQGVRVGDLVIQSMDAFAGAVGVSDSEGKCSPEYVVCLPYEKNTSCEYHALLLRIMAQRDYIFMICPSVRERAPRFRYSKFAAVKLAVPPYKEQLQILSWVSAMLTKNDALTDRANRQIELLKERRIALISASVTGKIDVRDWNKD